MRKLAFCCELDMFMASGDDDKILALKPMNCPGHVQIYKQGIKATTIIAITINN